MCTCDKSYKSIPPVKRVNRVKRVNSVRAAVFVQMIACATGSVLRVYAVIACSRVSVNDRMCTCDKSYKSIPPVKRVNRVKRVNSVRAAVFVQMIACATGSVLRVYAVIACSRVSVNDRMCTCDKSYKSIPPS